MDAEQQKIHFERSSRRIKDKVLSDLRGTSLTFEDALEIANAVVSCVTPLDGNRLMRAHLPKD